MKKFLIATLILFLGVAGTASSGAAYFETITIPVAGATGGQATGINDSGDIVGWYTTDGNISHGYRISEGAFSTIDYSGADSTVVKGINNNGVVVGYYFDTVDGITGRHGFLYDGTTYSSYDYNGYIGKTVLNGINDKGDIVGMYGAGDSSDPWKSFLMSGGTVTTFTCEGATSTRAYDINNTGTIVGGVSTWHGYYWDDYHGYTLTASSFTLIDVPFDDVTQTNISGINDNGDYVGTYHVSGTYDVSGFVMQGGTYETVNVPGADSTYANDINNDGIIVGGYNVGGSYGSYYGFIYSVPEPSAALLLVFGFAGLSGLRRKL